MAFNEDLPDTSNILAVSLGDLPPYMVAGNLLKGYGARYFVPLPDSGEEYEYGARVELDTNGNGEVTEARVTYPTSNRGGPAASRVGGPVIGFTTEINPPYQPNRRGGPDLVRDVEELARHFAARVFAVASDAGVGTDYKPTWLEREEVVPGDSLPRASRETRA